MKFEKGLVSIITPTYNSKDYIMDSVVSVINQTYSKWELIIVDDCSIDGTRDVLENIKHMDSRIKVIYSDVNSGPGVSRNIGLNNSTGQYIAFLDSDDIWSSTKLSSQIDYLCEKEAAICHTSFSFIDENGNARKGRVNVSEVADLETNLRRTEIGTSTAIIDRYIVSEVFYFPSMRARQDLKLWIYLLGLGYKSVGLDKSLVSYRVRSGSVSSNKFKMLYVTLKVYLSIKELTFLKRISCYISYVKNAIRKRGE